MLTNSVELAHDLRMPLQLIRSSAQMLRLSLEDDSVDARTYVDILEDSAEHMRRLLEGALESCGRAQAVQGPRPVNADLVACVRGLCASCRPYARQCGVSMRCGGNVAALRMALDADMLSRILLNLISNALRATPAGGRIRVGWRAMGDSVEVSVADGGPGIPPERLPYLFLAGETDGGHGFGLAIARELAAALGGALTARSTPGKGSVFALRLPVRSAQAG